ncbi:hypothetical protein G7074_06200 [Pedobacter sp. HDW13]|uniref:hypothetical protein n=1 Tax=Pedobacter sp. HDW13 TaxID=2714940 RepID=UPI00140D9437|nr:hypothetical protein [Pedobacter sp. HDW13]QIL38906.1 hypothetical protein G7074_06200 [Pedobacter sp. HDW13]
MKKLLLITLLFAVENIFAQENGTSLSFYNMEAVDTLRNFNPKTYGEDIKKINDNTYITTKSESGDGFFLIRKTGSKYILFDPKTFSEAPALDEIKMTRNFIVFENTRGGSARETVWRTSNYVIINTLNSKCIEFESEYERETWHMPEQRPHESDDNYFKRTNKKAKTRVESCRSQIKFDGLYLRVSRTFKNNCRECLAPGTYRLINEKFVKLKSSQHKKQFRP